MIGHVVIVATHCIAAFLGMIVGMVITLMFKDIKF